MDEERSCQYCYYEYFDPKAYPCSMCINGEERTDRFQPKGRLTKRKAEQTEPNSNADQHVQRVEYVEDDELKRCRECKHCVSEYRTPISASGRCYTYITCNANRCNYEQTEPQTDCAWK